LKLFWRRLRPNRRTDKRRKRHPTHNREIRLIRAHEEHLVGRREFSVHQQCVTNNGNHEGTGGERH